MADYSGTATGEDLDNAGKGEYIKRLDVLINALGSGTALEVHNQGGQGASDTSSCVIHHYTDAVLAQFDNVGSGVGLRIKNAYNPNLRADKPIDFVGSGDFLLLSKTNYVDPETQTGQDILRIKNSGEMQFAMDDATPIRQFFAKVDDAVTYAWHWYTSTPAHKYLFNLNGRFKFYHLAGDKNVFYSDMNLSHVAGGVETMLETGTITHHFKDQRIYGKLRVTKIQDSVGALPETGQVLTGQADGTCLWA